MPGKKITDQRMCKYKEARSQATQQIAPARMRISPRSARGIERADGMPLQREPDTRLHRGDTTVVYRPYPFLRSPVASSSSGVALEKGFCRMAPREAVKQF